MLSIIVAVSQNNIIGCNNKLVWDLKDDLKRFKRITINHTIIVGRKTFNSLPFVLPKRKHIVITKDKGFKFKHKDVYIEHNLKEIIEKYKNEEKEYFIIGGGEIYKQTLPYVNKIYLTKVMKHFDGDTFFHFQKNEFVETYKSEIVINNNIPFQYINYNRLQKN